MHSHEQYAHFTAIQLAGDVDFITWVKFPDERSDAFWREFLEKYPGQSSILKKAEGIVHEMQVVTEPIHEERAEQIWSTIHQEIAHSPGSRSTRSPIFMR